MKKSVRTAPSGHYLIGTVTRLTGLSADVIRVWERRYGAITPQRSAGGTRLYSNREIARLRQLKQAVEQGQSISQVATLSDQELARLSDSTERLATLADPATTVCERFLMAVKRMDVVAADQELTRAAMLFPPQTLVREIIAPILAEVGDRWAHQELGIAHEHLATGLLRNLLSALFRLYPPTDEAATIVLATPAGERHEFGLLLAALLAASRGWRVVYLGADLPAAEIALAVQLTKARVLALSLVMDEPAIAQELKLLAGKLPAGLPVWVGGATSQVKDFNRRRNWVAIRELDDFDNRLRG